MAAGPALGLVDYSIGTAGVRRAQPSESKSFFPTEQPYLLSVGLRCVLARGDRVRLGPPLHHDHGGVGSTTSVVGDIRSGRLVRAIIISPLGDGGHSDPRALAVSAVGLVHHQFVEPLLGPCPTSPGIRRGQEEEEEEPGALDHVSGSPIVGGERGDRAGGNRLLRTRRQRSTARAIEGRTCLFVIGTWLEGYPPAYQGLRCLSALVQSAWRSSANSGRAPGGQKLHTPSMSSDR